MARGDYAGGHSGFIVTIRPRPKRYKKTPQQEKIAEAAKACGIRKGMSRSELIKAMRECLPRYFSEHGES